MRTEQLNQLLHVGVKNGASDIHFKVGSPPAYRVHGRLRNLKSDPLRPEDTVEICNLLIADEGRRAKLADPPTR